jgi:hypothetical protein
MESNIIETQKSIDMAETKLKKKLRTDFSYKTAPPPRNYFVPNFGVDSDVRAT